MAKPRMASSSTCLRLFLTILALCSLSTVSGKPENHERHSTNDERSNQRHDDSHSSVYSSPNSLTFGNNELTSETDKKILHRLIGGHMRFETTTVSPEENHEDYKDYDDNDDEAKWDDGLIISSAGNGKEKSTKSNDDDDEKKTLSQQVKEGKYGLIQNEIYPIKPKRPGIISYLSNPEVPKDTSKNLGGLDEEEIWLAENHVLVLRGGKFPDHEKNHQESTNDENKWSPIDDYKAPKRQVKIPSKPDVPPPFPVQLTENGPIQIIGKNGTKERDEPINDYDNSQNKGFLPGEGPFFVTTQNFTTKDLTGQENTTKKLSIDRGNVDDDKKIKTGHVPPLNGGVIGPFYPALPPGAVFVVPPNNQSDYDEDDQSIYYPPPYSFYYKQDNSTPVPPGPLVPGIILPPPPDFFSGLEDKKSTTKSQRVKYTKRPNTTPLPRITPTYYPPRKTSAKIHKSTSERGRKTTLERGHKTTLDREYKSTLDRDHKSSLDRDSKVSTMKYTSRGTSFTMKPLDSLKQKSTTEKTNSKPIHVQDNKLPFVEITTSSNGPSDDSSRLDSLEYSKFYTPRPNTFTSPVIERTTKSTKNRWTSNVSSKSVPLVTYYSSSTPSSIVETIEATPASIKNVITAGKPRENTNQASYYFYEETNDDVTGTTQDPTIYYRATTESPYYRIHDIPQQQQEREQKNHYDEIQATPSQETTKNYGIELLEPVPKTSPYNHYGNSPPTKNSIISSRTKGQRMLGQSSPLYYDGVTERPRSSLQSYYTTTQSPNFLRDSPDVNNYDYDQEIKSKPVYQYSYEAADYYKRGQQQQLQQQQQQLQQQQQQLQQQHQNYYKPQSQQELNYKTENQQEFNYKTETQQDSFYKPENQQNSYYKPETQQQSYYKENTESVTQTPEPFDEWQDIRENAQQEQYDYDVNAELPEQQIQPERDNHQYRNRLPVVYQTTPSPQIIETTENPAHAYYTKQDEQLLDDVTREYFTNFGKKLRGENIPNTTPIYRKTSGITERPVYTKVDDYTANDYHVERQTESFKPPRVRVHYGDQAQRPTYSYEGDTRVNYKNPLPSIEPESEWIPGFDPKQSVNIPLRSYPNHQIPIDNEQYVRENLPDRRLTPLRNYNGQRIIQQSNGASTNFVPIDDTRDNDRRNYHTRPVSYEGDTDVNYRDPRPSLNPDAEFIDPGTIRENSNNPDKASYFAYRLPGDGGHFYFLTPQAISQRQDDNGGYLYQRPRGARFSRQRRRGPRKA